MAKSVFNLVIVTDEPPAEVADQFITKRSDGYAKFVVGLLKYVRRLAGIRSSRIVAWVDSSTDGSTEAAGDAQTATVTIDSHAALDSADTVTVGGKVLTWDTDMSIGANATEDATNLAAAINADATLAGLFSATSNAGVVTITAYGSPRVLRNFVLQVSDGTAMSVSAAHFGLDTTDTSQVDPITVGGLV